MIFACPITEWAKEGEDADGDDNKNDDESNGCVEATTKKVKTKQATAETLATIKDDFDNVLSFLYAVAVKSPRRHSIFERTSARASGSVDGRTPTSPHHPSRTQNITWVSRAS